jgi:hypothetical protein
LASIVASVPPNKPVRRNKFAHPPESGPEGFWKPLLPLLSFAYIFGVPCIRAYFASMDQFEVLSWVPKDKQVSRPKRLNDTEESEAALPGMEIVHQD